MLVNFGIIITLFLIINFESNIRSVDKRTGIRIFLNPNHLILVLHNVNNSDNNYIIHTNTTTYFDNYYNIKNN